MKTPSVLCIIGQSNTGKTTLIEPLVIEPKKQGLKRVYHYQKQEQAPLLENLIHLSKVEGYISSTFQSKSKPVFNPQDLAEIIQWIKNNILIKEV